MNKHIERINCKKVENILSENNGEDRWKMRNDFFCKNCGCEFTVDEMGLYLRGYDDSLTHFCPLCGWLEVANVDRFNTDPEFEESMRKRFEGEVEAAIYEYPNNEIVKMPSETFVKWHERELKKWRDQNE
jgi:hypothetical protein